MKGRILRTLAAYAFVGAFLSRAAFAGPGAAMVQAPREGAVPSLSGAPLQESSQGGPSILGAAELQMNPAGVAGFPVLDVLPDLANPKSLESWEGAAARNVSPSMARDAKAGVAASMATFAADQPVSAPVSRSIAARARAVARLRKAAARSAQTDEESAVLGDNLEAALTDESRASSSAMMDAFSGGRSVRASSGRALERSTLGRSLPSGSGSAAAWAQVPAMVLTKADARAVPPLTLKIYEKALVVSVVPAIGGVPARELFSQGGAPAVEKRTPEAAASANRTWREAVAGRAVRETAGLNFKPVAVRSPVAAAGISDTVPGSVETFSFLESHDPMARVAPGHRVDSRLESVRPYRGPTGAKVQAAALALLPPRSLIAALLPFLGLILLLSGRLFWLDGWI